jgi:hypothetical protein
MAASSVSVSYADARVRRVYRRSGNSAVEPSSSLTSRARVRYALAFAEFRAGVACTVRIAGAFTNLYSAHSPCPRRQPRAARGLRRSRRRRRPAQLAGPHLLACCRSSWSIRVPRRPGVSATRHESSVEPRPVDPCPSCTVGHGPCGSVPRVVDWCRLGQAPCRTPDPGRTRDVSRRSAALGPQDDEGDDIARPRVARRGRGSRSALSRAQGRAGAGPAAG